ncbi:TlpA family protein disulfide reductase [Paenibacillus sp. TRM 82003]|nr:TlpA family protein disulfide reductase [Paenibacillus sp. TRM 82003]
MGKWGKVVSMGLLVAASVVVWTLIIQAVVETNRGGGAALAEGLALRDMAGAEHEVLYAEKPTVLLFFTSWCPYCNEDAPKVVTLADKYGDDVRVYGVNLIHRDDPDELRAYVDRHGIRYPVLLDVDGAYYDEIAGEGFPALYFVDRGGRVTESIIGSTDLERIERAFRRLIREG